MSKTNSSDYRYNNSDLGHAHAYLLPAVKRNIDELINNKEQAFDLGCGNGSVANWLNQQGFEVTGVDPSISGIKSANTTFPELNLKVGSAYDALHEQFGEFPLVISLEVIEHLYSPRDFAKTLAGLLKPGGYAFVSTPYHGYWKNLAIALMGKFDQHFTVLWDNGHIKFFSPATLTEILTEAGLEVIRVERIGRIPALAKSMLMTVQKK